MAVGGINVGASSVGVGVASSGGAGVVVTAGVLEDASVGDGETVGDVVGVCVGVCVRVAEGDGVNVSVRVAVGKTILVRVGMVTSVGSTAPKVAVACNTGVAVFAPVRVGAGWSPPGWVINKSPKPIR